MLKKTVKITKVLLQRSILIALFIVILVVVATIARGYRLSLSQQKVVPTGILVASSYPTGAKVLIDGTLRGATNTNITLDPGRYNVEITKEGYSSWKKEIVIKGELVIKADALLYPANPSLSPITNLGVNNAWFFPSEEKVVLISTKTADKVEQSPTPTIPSEEDEETEGIYLLDTSKSPFRISNPLKLLAGKSALPVELDEESLIIEISPDADQILLIQQNASGATISAFLLALSDEDQQPFVVDDSAEQILQQWERERQDNLQKKLEALKEPLTKIASDSFDIIDFSPEKDNILYRAKKDITIPQIIKPPLIATNQTEETRNIETDKIYVYNIKEDKNYIIPYNLPEKEKIDISKYLLWYPDSQHIVINQKDKISIVAYDGTHQNTVYSGPYLEDFIGVTADFKLLIMANLNPETNELPDLYSVGIR